MPGGGEDLAGCDLPRVLAAQGAGGGLLAAQRRGLAGADELGGGQQARPPAARAAGSRTGAGARVRPPAPAIIVLFSPRGLRRAPPGEIRLLDLAGGPASDQGGGDEGAGLRGISPPSGPGTRAECSVTRTGSRSPSSPTGRQPADAGSVGQPAAVRRVLGRQGNALFHAGDHVPAREQDRGDQVIAGEVAVEAGHAVPEHLRPLFRQPFQQGLLPVGRLPRAAARIARPARAVSATTRSCANGEVPSAVPVVPKYALFSGPRPR